MIPSYVLVITVGIMLVTFWVSIVRNESVYRFRRKLIQAIDDQAKTETDAGNSDSRKRSKGGLIK